ncbi:MAG: cation diffusion facilitator family transporter [Candidatus Lokiarchaeota archaeon]|nr:cation diffusion facilitator family transporter [Candidatus Lokiarchaeota archaeon]
MKPKDKFYEQPVFINFVLLITNLTLFISKYIFGILTNSLALQTDAFDSLTDVVMCLIAFVGIFFSKRKPNKKFPYGYYKMENLISLIISLFIFFTAYNIIVAAISSIIAFINGKHTNIEAPPIVFYFIAISLLTTLILALYLKIISKKVNSPIIKSEAREKLLDCFISSSVIFGFIGVFFNFQVLDSIIALIISIFIIKGGYEIFLASTKTLLDAVINFDQRTELLNMIEKTQKIEKIEKMDIRSYGKYIFLELEISIRENFPISRINNLKKSISEDIMRKFPLIFKIIIIISGEKKEIIKIAIPLDNNDGLNSKIANHFGESNYFGFLEFKDANLLSVQIVENKFLYEEKRKGILVADWLISNKCDKIYLKKALNEGPSLIFKNNFLDIEIVQFETLIDVLNKEKDINET